MSITKKTLIVVAVLFIAIQFIRPNHNKSEIVPESDLSKVTHVSDSVQHILNVACYDCHSNNTNYPWYSNIEPVGWLITRHIKNAKEELNFSEFGSYALRRQISKLDGISNSVKDNIMPLRSYRLMHSKANLSSNQKRIIYNWTEQLTDSLASKK